MDLQTILFIAFLVFVAKQSSINFGTVNNYYESDAELPDEPKKLNARQLKSSGEENVKKLRR